jgi:YD repeat-containing protein
VTDANGHTTTYTLDGNGNVVTSTDAVGTVTRFTYDPMNRVTRVTLPRVDMVNNVDTVETTLYAYDKRGLQVTEVHALGDGTLSVFDGMGNLVQRSDADGFVTTYGYTPVNLVSAITYGDGTTELFHYDGTGMLTGFDDPTGATSIVRDLLDRILSVTDPQGRVTSYGYDPVGNTQSVGYPDGTQVDRYMDAENRVIQQVDGQGGVYRYRYDPVGNLTATVYPDSQVVVNFYDVLDRIVERDQWTHAGGKLEKTLYAWDPVGNLTSELTYNPGQSTNNGNGNGNNGNGKGPGSAAAGGVIPPPMTLTMDGVIVNPGGNTPVGLNRKLGTVTPPDPGVIPLPPTPGTPGVGDGKASRTGIYTYDPVDRLISVFDGNHNVSV